MFCTLPSIPYLSILGHSQSRDALFPLYLGVKPFACDFCEKSYTDNYSLKQHVAKVSIQLLSLLLLSAHCPVVTQLNSVQCSLVYQFPRLS
jgi:hypothetical protein